MFAVEKTLKEHADKISEEDKKALEDAIKEAHEGLEKAETEADVMAVSEKLGKVSDPIFTKFYQENPQAAEEDLRKAGFDPGNAGAGAADGAKNGTVDDDNMTPPEGGWED